MAGLYDRNTSYLDMSMKYSSQAQQAYGMQRAYQKEQEKTAGGAILSGGGMAASGALVGAEIGSAAGPGYGTAIGAAVGAIVGLAGYMFS